MQHLHDKKHRMVRSVCQFHVYCHVRRVLKRLQVPLSREASLNTSDSPYTNEKFFKICKDYGVSHDPMRYKDETFYWTYQRGVSWLNNYIVPDSMTSWIIKKSQVFTDIGLLRMSESVRIYTYLVLSSQDSMRSRMIGNMASALTAQKAFLNNFENIVNRRVDIQEYIKQYQNALSYTSIKADHNVGEHIYMLGTEHYFFIGGGGGRGVTSFGICRQFFLKSNAFQTIFFIL